MLGSDVDPDVRPCKGVVLSAVLQAPRGQAIVMRLVLVVGLPQPDAFRGARVAWRAQQQSSSSRAAVVERVVSGQQQQQQQQQQQASSAAVPKPLNLPQAYSWLIDQPKRAQAWALSPPK